MDDRIQVIRKIFHDIRTPLSTLGFIVKNIPMVVDIRRIDGLIDGLQDAIKAASPAAITEASKKVTAEFSLVTDAINNAKSRKKKELPTIQGNAIRNIKRMQHMLEEAISLAEQVRSS